MLVPALSRGGDGCECVRCVAGRLTVRRRQAHGLAQADAEALIRDAPQHTVKLASASGDPLKARLLAALSLYW